MAVSIMLDAGHGGRDPGAVYKGRQEKDDVLRMVLAVGQILENRGIDVQYTRTTDIYETPYQKAMKANEAGVDYFISIHRNSFQADNVASGVESLVYDLSGIKYEMAEDINDQLETIGFRNLGVKARPNLVVLKRTKMPAVLVELGFINSDTDNMLFDENFDAIALAIAEGILDTLMQNPVADMDSVPNVTPELTPEVMPDEEPEDTQWYHIQVGAFRNQENAQRLKEELLADEFPAFVSHEGPYYKVLVGQFSSVDKAADTEQALRRAGYQTVIVSG
nr:N-acetylmuramoyl-L-alanine amidase [uncultured Sellimonas sp.]